MNRFNSKGLSLIEMMVSIGLLGILGVITMSIFQDINQTKRSIEESQGLDLFTGKISSLLLDHDECTANLRGLTLSSNVNSIKKFKKYKNDNIKFENDDVYEAGDDNVYGAAIGGIPIIETGASSDYSRPFSRDYYIEEMSLEQANTNSSVALMIKFKKDKKRPGISEIKRKINLFVDFGTDGGNTILSCYSDLSSLKNTLIEKACEELTGSKELNNQGNCEIPTYQPTDCEAENGQGYHLVGFLKDPNNPKLYVPDCRKLNLATGYNYEVTSGQSSLLSPGGGSITSAIGNLPRQGDDGGPIITGSDGGPAIPNSNDGFLTEYNVEGFGSGELTGIEISQFKPAVGPVTGNPNGGSDLHCDNEFGANENGGRRYRNQYGSVGLTFTDQGLQMGCK